MIEISHLSKSFQGKEILHDITISVKEHETLCIIGPSGCGKTTLLRCLAGLEEFEGSRNVASEIGMVFQRSNLFKHLNVLHNLILAPTHVLKMSSQEAEHLAMQHLKSVGLAEKASYLPSQLSVGQKQRVAIARCLVMKPKVLILDEPLSALDPIASREVMNVLRKLKKEIALVMVTHDLSAVAELADRVVFLNEGRICEEGRPEQILASPQNDITKNFISHKKNLIYHISSDDFDRPELNARIELYCNKFGLGGQAYRYVQLAVEELLNFIELDDGINIILSKADNEVRMLLNVSFKDKGRDILTKDNISDDNLISLSILQGLCDNINEYVDNGVRTIHLELNQDRLLLK